MLTKFLTKLGPKVAANPALLIEAAPFLLIAGAAVAVYDLVKNA